MAKISLQNIRWFKALSLIRTIPNLSLTWFIFISVRKFKVWFYTHMCMFGKRNFYYQISSFLHTWVRVFIMTERIWLKCVILYYGHGLYKCIWPCICIYGILKKGVLRWAFSWYMDKFLVKTLTPAEYSKQIVIKIQTRKFCFRVKIKQNVNIEPAFI